MAWNAHFSNLNEERAYPLDDGATAISDAGVRLPSDILADLNLRWPSTLGNYAFVAAVSNAPGIVTVTFQAALSPTDTTSFAPLGVVSIPKPVQPGVMYAIQSQVPGVGGWITFGNGAVVGDTYSGRFSTPQQGLLTPRAARSYRPLPITSIQVLNSSAVLTGTVLLKLTPPLAAAKEQRELAGIIRNCIVISLVDTVGAEPYAVPSAASEITGYQPQSVFAQFAGPCAGRPESNTCGCPNPIEFINGVNPDCNGVITLQLEGCAQVADITDPEQGGLAVACGLGLTDACTPPQIPSSDGLLPDEYTPTNVPIPPPVVVPIQSGSSDSFIPVEAGPYTACFIPGVLPALTVISGVWEVGSATSPNNTICGLGESESFFTESLSSSDSVMESETVFFPLPYGSFQTASAATQNLAIFDVDTSSVFRQVITECEIVAGPTGVLHNAQLILNYLTDVNNTGLNTFFVAQLDYDNQAFELLFFNGTIYETIVAVVSPGIQLDVWYRITATVVGGPGLGNTTITLQCLSLTNDVTNLEIAATVSYYQPSTGKFGVGSQRSYTNFAYIIIDEFT